jgi:hypothetical protein
VENKNEIASGVGRWPVMATPRIKSTAILIGYNPDGRCVYSDILNLSDYYDGEHVWDKAAAVKRLKLQRVKGYLFDAKGNLDQEFESVFDLSTGIFKSGQTRYADGTVQVNPPDAKPG